MAPEPNQPYDPHAPIEVDLKNPALAALLAWMIPGMGHLYQRRTGKGLLFMICILGTFLYGLYLGEGKVVYASTPSMVTRWQYFCQLGVGLPALPALVQRGHVKQDPSADDTWRDFMRPPATNGHFTTRDNQGNNVTHPDELAKWHHDLSYQFELGTVFTVIAGLLNVLAIYDAYGGPLMIPPDDKKKE
jgi:hypothetical protein